MKQIVSATSKGELFLSDGNRQSRGLGDTVAKMTKAIGISPCGCCKKRQKWLNEKIPYRNKQVN